MQKLIILFLLFTCCTLNVRAQCNEFYQFSQGNEWEFEMYNAKGKVTGKNHQKVISYDKTSSGFNAVVNSVFYNDKGKETMKGDLSFKCENGIMYIDMRNFISEEQLQAFKGYEMKLESENLEMPSSLSVGQSLKDGSVSITAVGSGIPIALNMKISDRKVAGKETITTPAGTYECYKITSNIATQTQMAIKMNLNFSSVEWIALKVGTVKSESYNKSGKLVGYTILTSWK
ncbi:MAG TPA: hypothetical protein VFW11_00755 [Cyclobacteriaceae bacterium]|nr:hypothetical protein [Cyclobacteriaceae bacterium]